MNNARLLISNLANITHGVSEDGDEITSLTQFGIVLLSHGIQPYYSLLNGENLNNAVFFLRELADDLEANK